MSTLFPDARPAASTAAKQDWIHAHCDGGSRGNPGPSGYGALVTDAKGQTIAELSEFLGTRTNNYAEYSGLLACLDYALKNGHSKLKVVSDSELMVKQIQGKYKVNSPDLKPLWQEARNRIAKLDGFDISHALRHKNKEADALANQAMDRGMKRGGSASTAVESLPLRPPASTAPARPGTSAGAPLGRSEPASSVGTSSQSSRSLPPSFSPALSTNRAGSSTTASPAPGAMLRGFTKDGVVHLLGGATLPDGIFVKIIRE